MTDLRLPDLLEHMQQAAADAMAFTECMSQDDFLADKRTQQAVIMSLIVLGDAATKVMDRYPDFANEHAQVPWRNMRGMRNRIAHGYFDINLVLCGTRCKPRYHHWSLRCGGWLEASAPCPSWRAGPH